MNSSRQMTSVHDRFLRGPSKFLSNSSLAPVVLVLGFIIHECRTIGAAHTLGDSSGLTGVSPSFHMTSLETKYTNQLHATQHTLATVTS